LLISVSRWLGPVGAQGRSAGLFPAKDLRDEAAEKYHAIEGGQQTRER